MGYSPKEHNIICDCCKRPIKNCRCNDHCTEHFKHITLLEGKIEHLKLEIEHLKEEIA